VLAGKKLFLAYCQEGGAIVHAPTWQDHGSQGGIVVPRHMQASPDASRDAQGMRLTTGGLHGRYMVVWPAYEPIGLPPCSLRLAGTLASASGHAVLVTPGGRRLFLTRTWDSRAHGHRSTSFVFREEDGTRGPRSC
jgi:hypothetical protein